MSAVLSTEPRSERRYSQPRMQQSKILWRNPPKETSDTMFYAAYKRWLNETAFESNPRNIVNHHSFATMVHLAQSNPSIALLIKLELSLEPSMLVWVLDKALNEQPYSDEDAGDFTKMSEAWVNEE